MGKYVKRQTPSAMPTGKVVGDLQSALGLHFAVCGSRGAVVADNKAPDYEVHGSYRFAFGSLVDFSNRHLIVFVHGYNNTARESLGSARDFFAKLRASIVKDGKDPQACAFSLFTWPGDAGPLYFNDAQQYAHHSGVALYKLLADTAAHPPASISIVTHSLGAHVALRALSILGERHYHQKSALRVDRALLLAPAVENDAFERAAGEAEYHFPDAAFGVDTLHIGISRSDDVLGGPFRINEKDSALGFSGPESMSQLASLSRRVAEVSGGAQRFRFEVHDFSPTSATIMNPRLHVRRHGDYWEHSQQTDYYVNLIRCGPA